MQKDGRYHQRRNDLSLPLFFIQIMVNETIVMRCVPPDSCQQNSRCCHRYSVEDRGGTVGVFADDGTWEGDESDNHQQ